MIRNLLRLVMTTACLALCFGYFVNSASAQGCGMRLSTDDSMWVFQADGGATTTRTLIIANITNDPFIVSFSITGTEAFSVDPKSDTLFAGDTMSVKITYHASANVAPGTHQTGKLKIHNNQADCNLYLGLDGVINGKAASSADSLIVDPHEFSFGAIKQDSTACRKIVVKNKSTQQMTITGWESCDGHQFSTSPSFSNNVTLKPGDTMSFTVCYTPDSAHASASCLTKIKFQVGSSNETHTLTVNYSGTRKSNDNGGGNNDHNILVADPHEFSFGAVALGEDSCKTFTIYNTDSNSTAIITGVSKCEGNNFEITPSNVSDTLGPRGSAKYTICFRPDSAHTSAKCTLSFSYFTLEPNTDGHKVTISVNGTKKTDNGGHTEACMHVEQGDGYRDAVVLGASATRSLILQNPTGADIVIERDSLACEDKNAFALNASLPITIAAHSTAKFSYTFTPFAVNGATKRAYEACVFFYVSGDSISCNSFKGALVGFSTQDDKQATDSMPRPLFQDNDVRILAIQTGMISASKTFLFTNPLSVDAIISGATITEGSEFFDIQSFHPEVLPTTLHPGELFSVTITLKAKDNKVHTGKLAIAAEHSIAPPIEFELQGLYTGTASVKNELPANVTITMAPNPMSSHLTVTANGIRTATVEVYDILGKQLVTSPLNSTWSWDANSNHGQIAAGSYIVRVTGISQNYEQFVTSKRIVVK